MKKSIATLAAVITLSLLPAALRAQNPPNPASAPAPRYYHLRVAIEELNAAGQVTNTRTYREIVSTAVGKDQVWNQRIKTGSRIPVVTGAAGGNTQFQYIDLGVNLDVLNVKEQPAGLSFELKVEVSSIARQTQVAGTGEPVIRQNTWDSAVIVSLAKPTVVFSSDDLDSTGKMQVEVTATRMGDSQK
jgi:hypothetical protein